MGCQPKDTSSILVGGAQMYMNEEFRKRHNILDVVGQCENCKTTRNLDWHLSVLNRLLDWYECQSCGWIKIYGKWRSPVPGSKSN